MTEFQIQTINSQVKGCCNLFLDLEGLGVDDIKVFEQCDFCAADVAWLNLSNNLLTNIMHINLIKNVQTLNLSFNSIDDISSMPELLQLQKLKLAGNKLKSIDGLSNSLSKLQYLDISFNQISDIRVLKQATKLTHLIANHNYIQLNQLYHIGNLPLIKAVFVYHEKDQIQQDEHNFTPWLNKNYYDLRDIYIGYFQPTLKYLDKQIIIGYRTERFDYHLYRLCSSSGVREQKRSLYTKRHILSDTEKTSLGQTYSIITDIKDFILANDCFAYQPIVIQKLDVKLKSEENSSDQSCQQFQKNQQKSNNVNYKTQIVSEQIMQISEKDNN